MINIIQSQSDLKKSHTICFSYDNRHRHKTSNSPELLEFMKYDPFLIFWCIFCRNLRKIEYENEVSFLACRMPNFF
jgi:hypothetical protein